MRDEGTNHSAYDQSCERTDGNTRGRGDAVQCSAGILTVARTEPTENAAGQRARDDANHDM